METKTNLEFKGLNKIATTITIAGALNLGFIGLFNIDLLRMFFGATSTTVRTLYIMAGLGGLYCLSLSRKLNDMEIQKEKERAEAEAEAKAKASSKKQKTSTAKKRTRKVEEVDKILKPTPKKEQLPSEKEVVVAKKTQRKTTAKKVVQ